MFVIVWKQLKSPELSPFTITLHAWDGHSSQPLGMYHNYLVTLAEKIVQVHIEFIDAPLDYNILLGRSYTYAMSIVTSTVFVRCVSPMNGRFLPLISVHTMSRHS